MPTANDNPPPDATKTTADAIVMPSGLVAPSEFTVIHTAIGVWPQGTVLRYDDLKERKIDVARLLDIGALTVRGAEPRDLPAVAPDPGYQEAATSVRASFAEDIQAAQNT